MSDVVRFMFFEGIGLRHFLVFAALLFGVGLYGALSRRNAIGILMAIELMLNAVNINLIAFWKYGPGPQSSLQGQMFAVFVITLAAAEAAVGLAIVLAIFRIRRTVNADEINLLRG